jgi:hypothetical protein
MAEDMDDIESLHPLEREFISAVRAPVVVDAAAFDARVMAAVHRERPFGAPVRGRSYRKIAAFSAVATALAAVVAFVMIGIGRTHRAAPAARPVAVAAARSAVRTVRFTLVASGASRVAVAGSFNGWNTAATPLRQIDKNTWTADIPLGAGRYVYQFVIDGHRWVPDPQAPRDPGDDFGATNSVVTVPMAGSA